MAIRDEIKVGDKVRIKSNNNRPDFFAIVKSVGHDGPVVNTRECDNSHYPNALNSQYLFIESRMSYDRILEIVERKIDGNMKTIKLSDLVLAVENCAGANNAQRQAFLGSLLDGNHAVNVASERIIATVKNWGGGCKDEKEKFLQGLGLTMKEKNLELTVGFGAGPIDALLWDQYSAENFGHLGVLGTINTARDVIINRAGRVGIQKITVDETKFNEAINSLTTYVKKFNDDETWLVVDTGKKYGGGPGSWVLLIPLKSKVVTDVS
jgi:hypothetical protein